MESATVAQTISIRIGASHHEWVPDDRRVVAIDQRNGMQIDSSRGVVVEKVGGAKREAAHNTKST